MNEQQLIDDLLAGDEGAFRSIVRACQPSMLYVARAIVGRDRATDVIARPPISNERLKLSDCGQVVYVHKSPYRDGTTLIVMSPLEWLQRLAALVPRPRMHLIRYHGVLAPSSRQMAIAHRTGGADPRWHIRRFSGRRRKGR